VKDLPRQRGRESAVENRIHDVRRHQRRDLRARGAPEGEQFAAKERLPSRTDDRQLLVGVGGCVPVPRKMFPDGEDPPGERSFREGDGEGGRGVGIVGEGAVPDHRIERVAVDVEDRGEVHVDPDRPEFGGDRGAQPFRHRLVPAAEEGAGAGRGEPGERGLLQAGHPPSLLVDGDQRQGVPPAGGGADLAAQGAHLRGAPDVAGVEDDAPDLAPGKPPRKLRGKGLPLEADPQG